METKYLIEAFGHNKVLYLLRTSDNRTAFKSTTVEAILRGALSDYEFDGFDNGETYSGTIPIFKLRA